MPNIPGTLPQEVAARLDVSPSTLRRWSEEFAGFLSQQASSPPGKSHRRYTPEDITVLIEVKDLMNEGLTYEQVRHRLNNRAESPSTGALVSADDLSMVTMSYLSETIDELHQGQLSVLNSQAANRELMGVLIQDNFNLKDENARLRERMLNLEREMGHSRRDEIARRETMRQEFDQKLTEIREMVARNPITVLQSRAGCLGGLFGGGSQIQAVPGQNFPPAQHSTPPPPRPQPRPPGPPE